MIIEVLPAFSFMHCTYILIAILMNYLSEKTKENYEVLENADRSRDKSYIEIIINARKIET